MSCLELFYDELQELPWRLPSCPTEGSFRSKHLPRLALIFTPLSNALGQTRFCLKCSGITSGLLQLLPSLPTVAQNKRPCCHSPEYNPTLASSHSMGMIQVPPRPSHCLLCSFAPGLYLLASGLHTGPISPENSLLFSAYAILFTWNVHALWLPLTYNLSFKIQLKCHLLRPPQHPTLTSTPVSISTSLST